jgi:hypothetical protein
MDKPPSYRTPLRKIILGLVVLDILVSWPVAYSCMRPGTAHDLGCAR